jgi:hypothetical protein
LSGGSPAGNGTTPAPNPLNGGLGVTSIGVGPGGLVQAPIAAFPGNGEALEVTLALAPNPPVFNFTFDPNFRGGLFVSE